MNKSMWCLCGVILTLIAIFYFSSQSNLVSTKYSNTVTGDISKVYDVIHSKVDDYKFTENFTKSQYEKTENTTEAVLTTTVEEKTFRVNTTLVRKLAHVFLYCVLGLFFSFMLYFWKNKNNFSFVIIVTLLFGFVIGSLDEINQSFYKYRGSSFRDVMIDVVGVSVALLICFLVTKLLKKGKLRGI